VFSGIFYENESIAELVYGNQERKFNLMVLTQSRQDAKAQRFIYLFSWRLGGFASWR
jgi:hypothetical protein